MIQNRKQFREWMRNEMAICKNCGIEYLSEYITLRENLSEDARDAEIERGVNEELENQAESQIEWEPAFL